MHTNRKRQTTRDGPHVGSGGSGRCLVERECQEKVVEEDDDSDGCQNGQQILARACVIATSSRALSAGGGRISRLTAASDCPSWHGRPARGFGPDRRTWARCPCHLRDRRSADTPAERLPSRSVLIFRPTRPASTDVPCPMVGPTGPIRPGRLAPRIA